MINIQTFVFNPFSENTYILSDSTKACVIIDPGCFTDKEQEKIIDFIEKKNLIPRYILITHGHIDHVLGIHYLKNLLNIPVWLPRYEEETYNAVSSYAASYGFPTYKHSPADHLIDEGEVIIFGESSLSTIYAPGHSSGHVAFLNKKQNICIGGDTLFNGSIGRTDLPGGDFDTLIATIKNKFFILDESMVVYPGHGEKTTIGHEKSTNPFFTEKNG